MPRFQELTPFFARGYLAFGLVLGLSLGCTEAVQQTVDSTTDASGDAIAEQTTLEPPVAVEKSTEEPIRVAEVAHAVSEEVPPATDSAVSEQTFLNPAKVDAIGLDVEPRVVESNIWISDFELAKTRAKEEKKDILMDFTGSDWCGWCIKLHDEVFQYQEFADYADKNFVLLELDYPKDTSKLTPEIEAQNQELLNQFPVRGCPTIILADADGRPYFQTGYQPGGPTAYVSHLAQLSETRIARDEAFAAAESLEGVDKARQLHAALSILNAELVLPAYQEAIAEIVDLDEDNDAGLREVYESKLIASQFRTATKQIEQQVQSAADVDDALVQLDKIAAQFADYADGRLPLKLIRMQLLQLGERLAEATDVIDEIVKEIPDNKRAQLQLLVTKADFLVKLNRREDAKSALQQARDVADPELHAQIDDIEQQMFATDAPGL